MQILDARAKARAAREREQLRQQKQAEAAATKAARERQRARAAAERQREAAEAKAVREAAQAQAARKKSEQAERAAAARDSQRTATEAAKARMAAERAGKKAAVDANLAEVRQRNASLAADEAALERLLTDRAQPPTRVMDEAEAAFNREGPRALADAVIGVLSSSLYPPGLAGAVAAEYRPELRELVIELELPRQGAIPQIATYRYVKTRGVVEPLPRKEPEIKAAYARLVARTVLRTIAETFAAAPPTVVTAVALNGYVSTKDRATGRPIRPCLISVGVAREEFEAIQLDEPELDPQVCLRLYLNALVSPHPYDLEPVRPLVTFDLSRYKFVDEMNVVAGMDSRPDLLQLKPVEFEHLVRELFEAMGMKSWVTQASRDDGVDAVVVNEDPILGGLCVIQAKRYSKIVGLEAVNALAGVMNDKAAAKGILVTTSWVGQASRDFAARNGRMTIIEGRELRHLVKEHLGRDVLIGLDRLPPEWSPSDLGTNA